MKDSAALPVVFEHKWRPICPAKYKIEFDGTVVKVTYQNVIKGAPDTTKVYALHEVQDMQFNLATKWVNGSLLLKSGDHPVSFEMERNDEMQALISIITESLSDLWISQPSKVDSETNKIPLSDEIAKLHDMHMKGVLTPEEFAAAKAKLLDSDF